MRKSEESVWFGFGFGFGFSLSASNQVGRPMLDPDRLLERAERGARRAPYLEEKCAIPTVLSLVPAPQRTMQEAELCPSLEAVAVTMLLLASASSPSLALALMAPYAFPDRLAKLGRLHLAYLLPYIPYLIDPLSDS